MTEHVTEHVTDHVTDNVTDNVNSPASLQSLYAFVIHWKNIILDKKNTKNA